MGKGQNRLEEGEGFYYRKTLDRGGYPVKSDIIAKGTESLA